MEVQNMSQSEKEQALKNRENARKMAEQRSKMLELRKSFLKEVLSVTKLEVEYQETENKYNQLLIDKANLDNQMKGLGIAGMHAGVENKQEENESTDTVKEEK